MTKERKRKRMTIRFYEQNLIHFIRFSDEITTDDVTVIDKKVVVQYIMFFKRMDKKLPQ